MLQAFSDLCYYYKTQMPTDTSQGSPAKRELCEHWCLFFCFFPSYINVCGCMYLNMRWVQISQVINAGVQQMQLYFAATECSLCLTLLVSRWWKSKPANASRQSPQINSS